MYKRLALVHTTLSNDGITSKRRVVSGSFDSGKINTSLILNVVKLDLSNYVCPGRIVENTSTRATYFLNVR